MADWIPTPHVEARTTQRGAVERPEVEDEHVPWSEAAPGYSPRTTEFPLAWKTGEQGSDWTAALQKSFQPGGTGTVLLNPGGRTGLVGGWSAKARAGANQAVDPIITRFKPGAKPKTLQLLAYLRRDCNAWALPGAMVKGGEQDEDAMRRGLAEKGVSREISDLLLPPSPVAVAATQATAKPSTVTTQATAKPSTVSRIASSAVSAASAASVASVATASAATKLTSAAAASASATFFGASERERERERATESARPRDRAHVAFASANNDASSTTPPPASARAPLLPFCYRGYTDDSRNSDDAWIETTVYRFHLDEDSETNISSPGVKWVDISELGVAATLHIFSPHRIWVHRVADEILEAPMLAQTMRAMTLRLLFRPLTLSLEAVRLAHDSFVGVGALGFGEKQSNAQAIDASAAISSVTHVELPLGSVYCNLRPEVMAWVRQSDEGVKWVRCRCAPFAPVVVGWESRSRLSIPQDATHQAFVYGPLDDVNIKDGYPDPHTEPFERLLVTGGFVYVDCEGQEAKVVGVTYVDTPDVNAKDLYSKKHVVEFKGPHRMEERFRSFHAEKEHWTTATIGFLRRAGVESFMWLNPGESAGTHPIKFGAFAYSTAAADDGSASAIYYILKSEDDLRGASARVDLDSAGVKLPVEVARKHSDDAHAAAAAAADAAAHNWSMFHDAVAMGDASLVESLIKDDRLLPEELVELQLTKHKAAAAPSRTGIISRSFSTAEQSTRAAGETNRLDVPADGSSLTPLMKAAKLGHGDVVRTLLRRGASPMAQAQDGSTAIDFALRNDELSVEQLLHKLDAAIALVPALFRHSAGEALCYVTKIAVRAHIDRERRERSSPADAEKLQARADRAELLGIELFKTLSVVQRTSLLERETCRETMVPEVGKAKVGRPRGFVARAVNTPCQKTLLGDPTVQAAVNFRWYGPLIDSVLNGYVVTPNGDEERVRWPLARVGLLLLAAAVNLLFLPFVALWPPLRGMLIRFLEVGFELVSSHRTPYSVGFERKWSPSSQLYARSLYLLDEPFFQFAISTFSWLLLALVLTLMPTPSLCGAVADAWALLSSEGLEGMAPALDTVAEEVGSLALSALLLSSLLFWLLAHLIDEVETFSSNDRVKRMELSGISLALCSKLAPRHNRQMLSFGLLLMWLSWFMRIFSLSERLGTLTVMLDKMLSDTVQFLVFMVGCAVAFAAALHQLFLGRDILAALDLQGVEGCDKFGDLGEGLPLALKRLLLVAIDPAESIDCASSIAESLNEFYYSAPMIVSVYVIMSVVLLLNMLIAIMAKTFDDVWDKADDENRYLKAQLAVQYFGEYVGDKYWLSQVCGTLVEPGVPELLRSLWALWAKTREACKLVGSFCIGAGSWLRWLICLPCLRRHLPRDKAAQKGLISRPEGLLSSEGLSTGCDEDDLDPSNVRYVDGLGHRWSEQNTVEKLMELEEEIKRKAEEREAGPVASQPATPQQREHSHATIAFNQAVAEAEKAAAAANEALDKVRVAAEAAGLKYTSRAGQTKKA